MNIPTLEYSFPLKPFPRVLPLSCPGVTYPTFGNHPKFVNSHLEQAVRTMARQSPFPYSQCQLKPVPNTPAGTNSQNWAQRAFWLSSLAASQLQDLRAASPSLLQGFITSAAACDPKFGIFLRPRLGIRPRCSSQVPFPAGSNKSWEQESLCHTHTHTAASSPWTPSSSAATAGSRAPNRGITFTPRTCPGQAGGSPGAQVEAPPPASSLRPRPQERGPPCGNAALPAGSAPLRRHGPAPQRGGGGGGRTPGPASALPAPPQLPQRRPPPLPPPALTSPRSRCRRLGSAAAAAASSMPGALRPPILQRRLRPAGAAPASPGPPTASTA